MTGIESVLLYNFQSFPKQRDLKMIFLRMGIRMKEVTTDMYLQPIGALLRMKGFELKEDVYEGPGFSDEMMVLNGFSNARLDELLWSQPKMPHGILWRSTMSLQRSTKP